MRPHALALVLALGLAAPAFAQDVPKPEEPKKDEPKKDEPKPEEPKKDEPKAEEPKKKEPAKADENDLGSLEAKILEGKLHTPPRWDSKTGMVDLIYEFGSENELLDWAVSGADRADLTDPKADRPRPGRNKNKADAPPPREKGGLRLGVGSDGVATAVLQPIDLKGDFTIEATIRVPICGPSGEIVFLFGVHGADGTGARFGDQLVKVHGSALSPITKNKPSIDKFLTKTPVTVKLVRAGDEIKLSINGVDHGSKKLAPKDLDGKVGFLTASNVRIVIDRVRVHGTIDKTKL
jgi:hypothetical protein